MEMWGAAVNLLCKSCTSCGKRRCKRAGDGLRIASHAIASWHAQIFQAPSADGAAMLAAVSGRRYPSDASHCRLARPGRGDEAALVERQLRRDALWRLALFHGRSVLHADADR